MNAITRVAVIGVGAMGKNHVRVYSEMPNVELVGIADVQIDNAKTLSDRYHCKAYADFRALLDEQKPDAVTIAVPTSHHAFVAREAAIRGIHMLIEKPISLAINEGIEMINIAHSNHVTLAVGHVERFNPAIIELKSRITNNELGRVFQIDARRQGPFPPRIRDVGVVIDLAVHDLDIIRYISGSEPVRVFAEIAHRVRDEQEDMLCSTLRLNNGVIATLTINWLTPTKIRELQVIGERGMFRVDYITQDLYFFENATAAGSEWETLRNLRGVSEGAMTRFAIAKKEPLRAELEAFISTIKGEANNIVSGEDGLCALRLGLASLQSSQEECVIVLQN